MAFWSTTEVGLQNEIGVNGVEDKQISLKKVGYGRPYVIGESLRYFVY